MARQLIADMTTKWKPEDFADEFTAAIHRLAAQRVEAGQTEKVTTLEGEASPPASSNVVDLSELLKRSLDSRQSAQKADAEENAPAAVPAKKTAAKKVPRRAA
jgi:DNA end-binding protein Ku